LRARGINDIREKTPVFIPRLHVSLLNNAMYEAFFAEMVKQGKIKFAFLPGLDDLADADAQIKARTFLDDVVFFAEKTMLGTSGNDPAQCITPLIFYRALYPSEAVDAEFSKAHVAKFLQHLDEGIPGSDFLVGIAINDHGFPEVIEQIDAKFINDKVWAIRLDDFDLSGRGTDALVQKSMAMHREFRLDIFRLAGDRILPHQFAHAVQAGFDGILETRFLADASKGSYYTNDQVLQLRDVTEMPCHCPHCAFLAANDYTKLDTVDKQVALYLHNIGVAIDEMSRIRQLLRLRTFRDYLETRNHGGASLAVFQKKTDAAAAGIAITTVDLASRASINFIGQDSYRRPEIVKFRHKIKQFYHFPPRTSWIILLPCSAHKPYSDSPSHAKFLAAMTRGWKDWKQHCTEIIITSPIGAIPRQLERCFPAAHYDVPVTGYWDEQELGFSADILEALINGQARAGRRIAGIIAHVDGGYRKACELAGPRLILPITYTGSFESAASKDAIAALEQAIAAVSPKATDTADDGRGISPQTEDLRVLVDFQLETGAGRILLPGDAKPRPLQGDAVQVINKENGQAMFVIDGFSGHITFDKNALDALWKADAAEPSLKLKKITFSDTTIAGSNVFPGGVDAVDDRIAVGDDVFIQDRAGKLLGYGIAIVPGNRMRELKGGPVVSIVKKL